ncbi:hypothetical protein KFK09_004881 [Dendrobium nobile]|uniref:Uncharacterized protein n=1 Tax=Dendrobium nobile TaxID=94219 RepID=A0A8T3BWN5_DENNO|nr:hypothetical protein KFK09_004881 [Dendrobium nobile]
MRIVCPANDLPKIITCTHSSHLLQNNQKKAFVKAYHLESDVFIYSFSHPKWIHATHGTLCDMVEIYVSDTFHCFSSLLLDLTLLSLSLWFIFCIRPVWIIFSLCCKCVLALKVEII